MVGNLMAVQKVRVVPFVVQFLLQTDGTTNFTFVDIDVSQIKEWGPQLESIIVHCNTANRTGACTWRVVLFWSYDGTKWSSGADLTSEMGTAVGNNAKIHAAFTNAQEFGLKIRVALACKKESGTAIERAMVWATGSFVFRT